MLNFHTSFILISLSTVFVGVVKTLFLTFIQCKVLTLNVASLHHLQVFVISELDTFKSLMTRSLLHKNVCNSTDTHSLHFDESKMFI